MARGNLRASLLQATVEAPTMLDINDLEELTRVSHSTIYRAVKQGTFPAPALQVAGEKSSRWLTSDYVRWLDERLAADGKAKLRSKRAR